MRVSCRTPGRERSSVLECGGHAAALFPFRERRHGRRTPKPGHGFCSSTVGRRTMKNKFKSFSAAAIALLFLAACGSSGGGLGDIFGGGSNSGTYSSEIRGTVDSVDLNSNS